MPSTERLNELIEKEAVNIKSELETSTLFGLQIDFNNINMLILASYHMGRSEEMKNTLRIHEMNRLFKKNKR